MSDVTLRRAGVIRLDDEVELRVGGIPFKEEDMSSADQSSVVGNGTWIDPLRGGGGGAGALSFDQQGVPIPNNPHHTVNSTGVAIVFTDAGAGVADMESNPPYVDLRLPPYSLVANDSSPATKTANRIAMNQAILDFSGTGANLHLGQGDWYVDRTPATNHSILFGPNVSRLVFSGEGAGATRFIQDGDGSGAEWNLTVYDQCDGIEVYGITFLQGSITNPDPTQENHLIACYNSGGGGTTQNLTFHDFECGKCIGDAFRVLSFNPGDTVENVRATNFVMHLHGIVNIPSGRVGARSGIAIQRGWRNLEFSSFYIEGTQNQAIDMEPTGGPGLVLDGITFNNWIVDGTISNVDVDISFGGESLGDRAQNIRVTNGLLLNGAIIVASTDNYYQDEVILRQSIAFDTPFTSNFSMRQINNTAQVLSLTVERGAGSDVGHCIDIESTGDSLELDFDVTQTTAITAVHLDGTANVRLRGVVRDSGSGPSSRDGVEFFAVVGNADNLMVQGLQMIHSGGGKMQSAIGLYARSPRTMKNILIDGIQSAGSAFEAVLFSVGAGSTFDPNPIISNISNGTDETWRAEDAGGTAIDTVFPCIGGNNGTNQAARFISARLLVGNVTPNGNVVGNLGDLYRWCPTTTSAEFWVKTSQTSAGVPDNTGWQQITGLT